VIPSLLSALAEPNRSRIVELLAAAPRAVGEIAAKLDLRQPQVTKHLQTLERAGLVTMHPLGQRRIYALRREPLRELVEWLEPFTVAHPSEEVLEQYQAAIEAERVLAHRRAARKFVFSRDLPAPPPAVWLAWTSADIVRRWWSPTHFEVADCEVEPVVGGRLRIVMAEGDGARHTAVGRFLALEPPTKLSFELDPVDAAGVPLFRAVQNVRLARRGPGTRLSMTIRVTDARPEAAPALAGIELGWEQLLDNLAGVVAE
jgi:uncharacterized protein YndB with AHSA1/START domain/DNA-binding MarR family transcriptional regulator